MPLDAFLFVDFLMICIERQQVQSGRACKRKMRGRYWARQAANTFKQVLWRCKVQYLHTPPAPKALSLVLSGFCWPRGITKIEIRPILHEHYSLQPSCHCRSNGNISPPALAIRCGPEPKNMPELAAQETCLGGLPSLQSPFHIEPTGSPYEYHGSPAANGSIIDSTYYPSAFLQAGAVLAVHLAARTRTGQDLDQHVHGNVPGQNVDPDIGAAGAGPGVGPAASGLSVDLSLTGTGIDDGNILPCRSDCPAPSLANFHFTGNLTDTYQTEAFAEAATASDSDHFGHADNSTTPSPPPRKRRRFEDKPEERQHLLDQHVLTELTQESPEMGRLLLPPEFGSPAELQVDAMLEEVKQLVAEVLQEPSAATKTPTAPPSALPTTRPLGLVPERTPFSFFHFPGEIRNPIYSYSLHWPTTQELYRAYYSQLDEHYRYEDLHPDEPKRRPPTYKPKFRTPTILLLCRRITLECLGILQHRTLVIDGMPPWQMGDLRPLPITSFIPKTTFQAIRRLEIRIPMGLGSFGSGWVWSDIACDLFDMLRENNSFEHLRVVFVIRYSPGNGAWRTSEQHHLELIDHSLVRLERENPNLKWPCKLEREYWIVEGRRASKAHTNSKGELHPSNEELRTYPDEEIWPGCVLDFV